jgi:hypothetical protein
LQAHDNYKLLIVLLLFQYEQLLALYAALNEQPELLTD